MPTKEEESRHKLPEFSKSGEDKTVKQASNKDETEWIQFDGITLSHLDRLELRDGNFAQHLLKKLFPFKKRKPFS